MKLKVLPFVTAVIFFTVNKTFSQGIPDNFNAAEYTIPAHLIEGTHFSLKKVIIKLKPEFQDALSHENRLTEILNQIQASTPIKSFLNSKSPDRKTDSFGRKLIDLSGIYEFDYQDEIPVRNVIDKIRLTGMVEYVQPEFFITPFGSEALNFVINDPLQTNQWHLNKIKAFDAWDVNTGNPSVKIAISDGGTLTTHPDLGNIALNLADPVDGVDNDGDGWIDNYEGWNTGSNNNNPNFNVGGGSTHGVFVAGLAAATTNNGIGVAGTGFNCRYIPIKIVNASNQWVGGDKSIYYAAESGAPIINLSWGTVDPYPLLQDVIRYAAINKGCLIIAAAGNGAPSPTVPYYPASYEYVLSVAGTDSVDQRFVCGGSSSSYNEFVDISAPAWVIYSTLNGSYGSGGCGTSYATPMVSGAAGLIKSQFPTFTAGQIESLLKESSVNIDAIPANVPMAGKLGEGRLNMAAALAGPTGPYLYMTQRNFSDGNDNQLFAGETVNLSGILVNYLNPSTAACSATLSSNSAFITITDANSLIGNLGTLSTMNNTGDPFTFSISASCPVNHTVIFKITYNDGAYTSYQHFSLIVNPSFVNITANQTHTTICSNGRIGYNNEAVTQGLGLSKNGMNNFSTAGSLMIGVSPTKVSDATLGNPVTPFTSDFVSVNQAKPIYPSVVSDFDVAGKMNDNGAGANKLDVEIDYSTYAWNAPGNDKYVIFEYVIKNTGSSTLSNFFGGLYNFWEIPNSQYDDATNTATYDATRRMGYAFSNGTSSKYAAVKLLSYTPVNYYAFNNNGVLGSINIFDGFTDAEKFSAISNGIARPMATGTVSSYIGTGPIDLQAGTSARISFALITGDNLADVQSIADAAQLQFDQMHCLWTGAVDTLWTNPGNWHGGNIPTASENVLIKPVSNQPVVNTVAQCQDLTTVSGAHVKVHNNQSLSVNRMLTNLGEISVRSGGNLVQTASSLLTGTGQTHVVRSISSNPLNPFHFMGIPVQGAGLNDIADDIGGFGLNAFAVSDGINIDILTCSPLELTTTTPYGNIFQYNETETVNCMMEGWEVRTTNAIQPGRGYAVIVPNGNSVKNSGIANNQDLTFSGITRTNANLTAMQGFNLIGNPYPSAINWNTFRAGNASQIQASTYLYNQGSWITYDAFSAGQNIAAMQGFEVEAAPAIGTYSVTFKNNHRTAAFTNFYSDLAPYNYMINVLVTKDGFTDVSKIVFTPNATEDFDFDFDGRKMTNEGDKHNFFTLNNNGDLHFTVNALPNLYDDLVIPAKLLSTTAGVYHFDFQGISNIPPQFYTYIQDFNQSGNPIIPITNGYSFQANENTEYNFNILFKTKAQDNSGLENAEENNFIIQNTSEYLQIQMLKDEKADLKIYTADGKLISQVKNQSVFNVPTHSFSSGIYIVQLVSNQGTQSRKISIIH